MKPFHQNHPSDSTTILDVLVRPRCKIITFTVIKSNFLLVPFLQSRIYVETPLLNTHEQLPCHHPSHRVRKLSRDCSR